MKDAPDYMTAMTQLFNEAFEGRPAGQSHTWFVEGTEGIFDVLDAVDSTRASKRATLGSSTIYAHLNHARYALWLSNSYIRGEAPASDWEGSWAKQECSDEEWAQLGQELRKEFMDIVAFFETKPQWPEQDWLLGAMALLPHMAYHLGAVRQLIKLV